MDWWSHLSLKPSTYVKMSFISTQTPARRSEGIHLANDINMNNSTREANAQVWPHAFVLFHRCSLLCTEWEELEDVCKKRAAHLSKAITREQVRWTFYVERRWYWYCSPTIKVPLSKALAGRLGFNILCKKMNEINHCDSSVAAVGLLRAGIQTHWDAWSGEQRWLWQRPAGHTKPHH